MTDVIKNCDGTLFNKIDEIMKEEKVRLRCGFDKAGAFINGLFCDLASIDIRFEFDPVSLDDCRCEKVALNEFNIMCTLKYLPYEEMELVGDGKTGAVKVKLLPAYVDSYDKACWEDVCSQYPGSTDRYLDTNKIRQALCSAIQTILACESQEGATIKCNAKFGFITLIVNLHVNGVFRFNLVPAMWVSRNCLPLKKFDERIARVFNTLGDIDCVKCIQIVARPKANVDAIFWRITFNDLENRILNISKYTSVQPCIFAIHALQTKHLSSRNLPTLSLYNIRLIALREILKNPESKEWSPENFAVRLNSMLKSAKIALKERNNCNIFTRINILGNCDKKDVKYLAREFNALRKFHKELLILLP